MDCLLFFEKRKIHIYINFLGFHAVEFTQKNEKSEFRSEEEFF